MPTLWLIKAFSDSKMLISATLTHGKVREISFHINAPGCRVVKAMERLTYGISALC